MLTSAVECDGPLVPAPELPGRARHARRELHGERGRGIGRARRARRRAHVLAGVRGVRPLEAEHGLGLPRLLLAAADVVLLVTCQYLVLLVTCQYLVLPVTSL